MKKLLFMVFLAGSLATTAQKSNAAQAIYDKLEDEENVLTLSFNKKMLESIDTDIEWGDQIKYLKGDLHKVKLMLVDEDNDNAKKIVAYIENQLDKLGYKLADLPDEADDDDGDEILVFTNRIKNKFTEAHFLIKDEDGSGILMSVYGDFTVTESDEKI